MVAKGKDRECIVCGKLFHAYPYRIARGQSNYCSLECFGKARRTALKRECVQCGAEFSITPSQAAYRAGLYCSLECSHRANSGERHHLYKGGHVGVNGYRYIQNKLEHRIIAERALNRSLGSTEIVHHIDGDRLNNSLDNLMLFEGHDAHANYHAGKAPAGMCLRQLEESKK